MNILIENETDKEFEDYYEDIELVIKKTLEFEKFPQNVEISVTFISDEDMKELNKKFRNIDKTTDVLSFPLIDDFSNVNFDETIYLGDIIISSEKAISQAYEYGHSIRREITFLTIHSVLHLLGYDHMEELEEKEMISKQKEIFKLSNIALN